MHENLNASLRQRTGLLRRSSGKKMEKLIINKELEEYRLGLCTGISLLKGWEMGIIPWKRLGQLVKLVFHGCKFEMVTLGNLTKHCSATLQLKSRVGIPPLQRGVFRDDEIWSLSIYIIYMINTNNMNTFGNPSLKGLLSGSH